MPKQPNILFIISDQHKWDVTGCYGHPMVKTPNIDAFAASGTRFTSAYCASPLCVTSRAAIMTGQYPHTNQVCGNRSQLPTDAVTMGDVFRSAGYATATIGKVHIPGETRQRDLGFDERAMRIYTYWFEDYINEIGEEGANNYATYRQPLERFQTVYNPTNEPVKLRDDEMYDHLVVERCIDFMGRHRDGPFLLWAGLEKPHTDWTAPARYHAMYDPAAIPIPETAFESRTDMPQAWYASTRQSWCFDDDELHNAMAAYYANVTYLDDQVGRLLEGLSDLGLADDTLIVYTTDHGEMCFEHGMVQKQNFFEASAHVPLIVKTPASAPGQATTHEGFSNLIDLFPTFCDAAGIAAPATLEGTSLLPACQGQAAAPNGATFCEYYEWGFAERMIRTGPWKYVYSQDNPCQLYNLTEDPAETHNLIDSPACRGVRESLHRRLMDGWEIPDMTRVTTGGAWNDISAAQARELMEQRVATGRRVHF